ncbi:MAG TPA: DUF1592 domain-containing protein [Nannocystaceae bacterium]|nr:DUF1592 domain-containing protein [Nannocystaceae bacterium]
MAHGHRAWACRSGLVAMWALFACYDGTSRGDGEGGGATADDDAGSGGGASADDGADDDGGPALEPFVPGELVLPRLTASQYRNALVDLLGPGLPPTPVEGDTNPYLFYSIGAASTTLSELGTQLYEEAADTVTHAVFDDPVRRVELVGCEPVAAADGCVAGYLAQFGRRAFRRPLTEAEHSRYLAMAAELAQPDAWEGLRLAVAGMLQSPYFLYRVEIGAPDPEDPTRLRYSGYEMASRMSFLLWDSIPDDLLLAAAERGELDTREGLEAEALRLLADERASASIRAFFAQYLDLGRLDGLTRDPELYPLFTATMPDSMRTETELVIDDVVFREKGDVRTIFSTRRTFVNDELATLYGIDAPGAGPITFVPVELPEDGARAGILTLGGFLTMNARQTKTSPTLRGRYLRERVLCQTVPDPPPDVNTDLQPSGDEPETVREQLEQHRENPACAACHAFIDPPGLLFENFDAAGVYRTEELGKPIDASGDLDGIPLDNARGLADVLAEDPRIGLCIVRQLFRHAQGRLDTPDELPVLENLGARFEAVDYRFDALLVELVTHDGFRTAVAKEGA